MQTVKQYRDRFGRYWQLRPSTKTPGMVFVCDSAGWTGATQPIDEVVAEFERAGYTFEREWTHLPPNSVEDTGKE